MKQQIPYISDELMAYMNEAFHKDIDLNEDIPDDQLFKKLLIQQGTENVLRFLNTANKKQITK